MRRPPSWWHSMRATCCLRRGGGTNAYRQLFCRHAAERRSPQVSTGAAVVSLIEGTSSLSAENVPPAARLRGSPRKAARK